MHRVMLTQLTSSMTVEALKQWVSAMRMIGFTVPSAKTMARSRADIVNAIIDCDKPSKSPPTNVEGPAGVVHPGRPGTPSALRLGQTHCCHAGGVHTGHTSRYSIARAGDGAAMALELAMV